MSCSALQESWEEIEKAVLQSIEKLEEKNFYFRKKLQRLREIVFPNNKEILFQRRKELVIGLEEIRMTEDLLIIAEEKSKVRSWIDSILFIIQGSFTEIIWNY